MIGEGEYSDDGSIKGEMHNLRAARGAATPTHHQMESGAPVDNIQN